MGPRGAEGGRGGPSHSASLPRFNNHILFKSKSGLPGLQPWHQQRVFHSAFKGDEAFKVRHEPRSKDSENVSLRHGGWSCSALPLPR